MHTKISFRRSLTGAVRASLILSFLAGAVTVASAGVGLKKVAEGFTAPILVTSLADGSGRVLIADQHGTVQILNKDGALSSQPFLDVRPRMCELPQGFGERGLLGLALHPKFRQNGRLYVVYSAPLRAGAPAGWNHTMNLSEFKVRPGNLAEVDPASERVLMQVDKPYDNHNCGRIAFGPDGLLYYGVGDGGGANGADAKDSKVKGHVAGGNSQDLSQPLGKILRIDVDHPAAGKPYGIPSDNPLVRGGGMPEIYAWGLRNPWGLAFDRGGSHELFAADVGQASFEEINIIVKGGNYGWNRREGFICFDPANPTKPPADCPKVDDQGRPFIDPILAYKNFTRFPKDPESRGTSVTGGYVYRGKALPQLAGKYVFADWSRAWVKADGVLYVATRPAGGTGPWTMEPLEIDGFAGGAIKGYVWALGEDEDGELYVMTNTTNALIGKNGKVWKLVSQ